MRKKYTVYCLNGPLSIMSYYESPDIRESFGTNYKLFSEEEGSFMRVFDLIEEKTAYMKGVYDAKNSERDAMFIASEEYIVMEDSANYKSKIKPDHIDTCWLQFCKKHYPEYNDSQLVKEDVDLYKYIEEDFANMSEEAVEKIDSMGYESKEDIVRELVRLETTIFKTALEEYYKKRYGIEGL